MYLKFAKAYKYRIMNEIPMAIVVRCWKRARCQKIWLCYHRQPYSVGGNFTAPPTPLTEVEHLFSVTKHLKLIGGSK